MKYLATLFFLFLGQNIHADPPGFHGMVLFGKTRLYASHLPMFHSPHHYQWIFELQLDEKALAVYLQDQEMSGNTLYSMAPSTFVLPEMVENPKPFTASLFRGHFEKGGQLILRTAQVNVVKTVFFKQLNADAELPFLYSGLLFGNSKEIFLAHRISGAPDFDQIVQVTPTPDLVQLVAKTHHPFFLESTANQHPLSIPSTVQLPGRVSQEVHLQKQIHLEFDDLKH